MRKTNRIGAVVLAVLLASAAAMGLIMTQKAAQFPASWPTELEPYHAQATLVQVAHGIQEDVYEIPFTNSQEFEKAWPYFLKLKSKGAPMILESSPSTYGVSGSTMSAGVRVLWPSGGISEMPDGTRLTAGPPWPESILSPVGGLPEYVVVEGDKWVPYTGSDKGGFRFRARVDIVLVVDGRIVDLNRIRLPRDTPIIDNRKPAGQ
jgi:hypothetical protein